MAWSSGFFNSVNGDRLYNSQQLSELFKGLISNGVYEAVDNKMAVEPNNGMTIQIATGRGYFSNHWVDNSTEYLTTLEASDVTLNRYAAICVRVDDSDSGRKAEPYIKYSDYATTPVKPAMTRSEYINEYCLAYVYIGAGVSEITAADIEDTRFNTELCGWVTGLIKQLDTNTLYTQWQALFDDWFNHLQDLIDSNVETRLVDDVDKLNNQFIKVTGVLDGLAWNSIGDGTYEQTITVEGVTADNSIMVTPTHEYKDTYLSMGCVATSQDVDSITFSCTAPQDVAVEVDVVIVNL